MVEAPQIYSYNLLDRVKYKTTGIIELYIAGVLEEWLMIKIAQDIRQFDEIEQEAIHIEEALIFLLELLSPNISKAEHEAQKDKLLILIQDNKCK